MLSFFTLKTPTPIDYTIDYTLEDDQEEACTYRLSRIATQKIPEAPSLLDKLETYQEPELLSVFSKEYEKADAAEELKRTLNTFIYYQAEYGFWPKPTPEQHSAVAEHLRAALSIEVMDLMAKNLPVAQLLNKQSTSMTDALSILLDLHQNANAQERLILERQLRINSPLLLDFCQTTNALTDNEGRNNKTLNHFLATLQDQIIKTRDPSIVAKLDALSTTVLKVKRDQKPSDFQQTLLQSIGKSLPIPGFSLLNKNAQRGLITSMVQALTESLSAKPQPAAWVITALSLPGVEKPKRHDSVVKNSTAYHNTALVFNTAVTPTTPSMSSYHP